MRHKWHWTMLAALAAPAWASEPVDQVITCPIGGMTFTYSTTASYSIWGSRPDGKPNGNWRFPIRLPKCPDNGLVIFDSFSKEELDRLKPLVESAEYRALFGLETDYFLAAWLMERLGREPIDVAWMVVQASWEADFMPEIKTRYQALYVDKIRKLPRSGDGIDWLAMQGRAVNGLRELGRFDEAKAMLASLDLKPLDVEIPKERTGAATPSGFGQTILNYDEIVEAKRKRGLLDYFERLRKLLAARDSSSEPLQALSMSEAAQRCRTAGYDLSKADKDYCASKDMKAFMARSPE